MFQTKFILYEFDECCWIWSVWLQTVFRFLHAFLATPNWIHLFQVIWSFKIHMGICRQKFRFPLQLIRSRLSCMMLRKLHGRIKAAWGKFAWDWIVFLAFLWFWQWIVHLIWELDWNFRRWNFSFLYVVSFAENWCFLRKSWWFRNYCSLCFFFNLILWVFD